MSQHITFGTSGHRGIMGDAFTHAHVKAIGEAVATLLRRETPTPTVAIGYDPRQGNHPSEDNSFTQHLCATLTYNGCDVILFDRYTPTPVISWSITHHGWDGGLILTASHNPPEYNGIKFNPKNGAPAPKHITNELEELANHYMHSPLQPENVTPGRVSLMSDAAMQFAHAMKAQLEAYGIPTSFQQRPLAVDTKHGACAETWHALAQVFDFRAVLCHEEPDSQFKGIEPNPTRLSGLDTLKQLQVQEGAPMAAANDPDGDRHMILDEKGNGLTPEETATVIAQFFLDLKLPLYGIATTVASSGIIQSLCQARSLHMKETAVGFKYFSSFFDEAVAAKGIGFGVESSGGFSTSFHTHEKCGFLPVILLLACITYRQTPLSSHVEHCRTTYGFFTFLEDEYRFDPAEKTAIQTMLTDATLANLQPRLSDPIASINTSDGLKIIWRDNSWGLLRLSGTEPVCRLYTESLSETCAHERQNNLKQLLKHK